MENERSQTEHMLNNQNEKLIKCFDHNNKVYNCPLTPGTFKSLKTYQNSG